MSKSKDVYVVMYEYSYANNNDGRSSPESAGGILGIYEDEDDAEDELNRQKASGEWGDFSGVDPTEPWSNGGYILFIETESVIPSSKGEA
jgi:hypothetical protein